LRLDSRRPLSTSSKAVWRMVLTWERGKFEFPPSPSEDFWFRSLGPTPGDDGLRAPLDPRVGLRASPTAAWRFIFTSRHVRIAGGLERLQAYVDEAQERQSPRPYEIIGEIGSGAMGEVYRARDARLQRDVAIKVLPSVFARDPDRLVRFEREAQVLASLNHPNIAAIYGLEESDDGHALVMELVEGPTLAEYLGAALDAPVPSVSATREPSAHRRWVWGPSDKKETGCICIRSRRSGTRCEPNSNTPERRHRAACGARWYACVHPYPRRIQRTTRMGRS